MDFKAKVAIIGGGKRGMLILATLYGEKNIEIVGISDINPSAPAASLASELGIFFTVDFHELLSRNNINFVINATDNGDISRELDAVRGRGISVIDGDVTAFLLDVLEKLKRDSTHLQQYLERQTMLYKSLEQSREFLNKVINTSADMIMVTDREGFITECNNASERLIGYQRSELVGTRAADYWYSPEERRKVTERLKSEGCITNYETKLIRKDGRHVDISLSISLLRDDSNNIIGTVGVSKDITEKKRYERDLKNISERLEDEVIERTRELKAANIELERSNKLKSQFIANMSHELRTPLNSIIGFSETLLEMPVGALNEKQQRFIQRIYSSGKHLLHLINNLLDLAKIEAGRFNLVYEEFLLLPVIEETISIVDIMARKKDIHLHYHVDEGIKTMMADRVKFKQILYNLLSNAIKFTPDKGEVYLEAKQVASSEGILYGLKGDCQELIRVSVRDTGIGIRPEDIDRIFDEFEQADGSYTRKYEGTGIGLSLTKKLVEMHGGFIDVESKVEEGSKFSFVMPLFQGAMEAVCESEQAEKIVAAKEEDLTGEGNRITILVVEDDMATAELLTSYLKDAGYHIAHAYNGIDAVKRASQIRPFAIILDVMLPGKDGWEVLQDIRALPETKDIPVIIYSVIDNRDLGFALGATDYLTKPVDRRTLLARLNYILSDKKRHQIVNVMVVDDDPDAAELFTSALEQEGYNIIKAYGGKEALKKAEEIKLDAIFLDLMMPDIDGFEVVQRLKGMPSTRDIPIFIVTAKDINAEDRLLLAGQIERIYHKSQFSKEDLVEQIKTLELMYPVKAGLIDETSRLFNQAYFQLRLAQEMKRAERYKEALSLAMIDIDEFNLYTTKVGPYYGTLVVKKIAELMRKGLRGSDVITRVGAGGFALILTKTLKQPAVTIARRFKSQIESYSFYGMDVMPGGKFTLSMGVASYPEDAADPEALIHETNSALRSAKDKGGNQVIAI